MSTLDVVLLQILNTAVIVGVLMLVAIGLAIIYGLMDVLNLAHGELLMLGCYGVVIANDLGLNLWLGVLLASVIVGLLGWLLERVFIRRLYGSHFAGLLGTWGLGIILVQTIRLIFGPEPVPVRAPLEGAISILGTPFPQYRLAVLGISAGLIVLLLLSYRYLTIGIKTRAVFQDQEMAQCCGIRAPRIYAGTFSLGASLAGVAGGLIAPLVSVDPFMGAGYLVRSFMTVIVGGVGSLGGVAGGAGVIGGAEGVISYFSSGIIAQVVVLALAIVVVRIRPQGLFVRK